jgi:hypothetical protein
LDHGQDTKKYGENSSVKYETLSVALFIEIPGERVPPTFTGLDFILKYDYSLGEKL